jgi:hypothetical protein
MDTGHFGSICVPNYMVANQWPTASTKLKTACLTVKHYQDPWESYITKDCTLTSWSRVPPFYEPMAHNICFKNHRLQFTHFWVS